MIITKTCPRCGCTFTHDTAKGYDKIYCSHRCANVRKHTDETKLKISQSLKTYFSTEDKAVTQYKIWQKKMQQNQKLYTCQYCGNKFTSGMFYPHHILKYKYCSEACKEKYKNEIWKASAGGYRKGSGHGKSGWYKGIYCDSSWELAFVVYHLDHQLHIERCHTKRTYIYQNQTHSYYPDFITDEGIIEIKGYVTDQWREKEKQNQDIKVLYKDDMQPYLDYVIKTYGKTFISLYDDSKYIKPVTDNLNLWMHQYNDSLKLYYTVIISPADYEKYIADGWIRGRGKCPEGYTKEHIKTKNIFVR